MDVQKIQMIRSIPFLIILTVVCSFGVNAQSSEPSDHEHKDHQHLKNEIGFASAPVYLITENEFAFGLHFHYVRNIAESKFGLGLGYERIFDNHKHNNIGVVVSFRPIEAFAIDLTPGVNFEVKDPGARFAIHLETTYEFELNRIHLGPVLEFAYA